MEVQRVEGQRLRREREKICKRKFGDLECSTELFDCNELECDAELPDCNNNIELLDSNVFSEDTDMFDEELGSLLDPVVDIPKERHYLGRMNVVCKFCNALHWDCERLVHSSKKNPLFGGCCLQGKINLPALKMPPPVLKSLFEGSDKASRSLRQNFRSYNAANAFASLGAKIDDRVLKGLGPRSFTIHGELRHKIGSFLPLPDKKPTYSQIYIYDSQSALEFRKERNPHLCPVVLKTLQDVLLESNELCKIYKNAYEILNEQSGGANDNVVLKLKYVPGTDRRRYNLPTSNEIAAILPAQDSEKISYRDIILHLRGNGLQRISECHPLYLPSHYVLLFPYGELGWSPEYKHYNVVDQCYTEDRLSLLEYHSYRMYERETEYSTILRGCSLFQEYVVDAWAAYDQNRLNYIKNNQDTIRADVYQGFTDIIKDGVSPSKIGQRFILPSSHLGSPRSMYEIYQDSMAICRYNKHPDIFLTATANANWPEIRSELKSFQTALDRPELVARVFEAKREAIMNEILKKEIFGKVAGYVYTIEFQKRGLPHMHALIFLQEPYKITTASLVDRFISAEIPNKHTHPHLYETVMKCMVHGPCGPRNPKCSCMENGYCLREFPKDWAGKTSMDVNGYPLYMRRESEEEHYVKGVKVDNRDIVPYNPHLTSMFDCHINVEVCSSVLAVKYIHKYIDKGYDMTTVVLGGSNDEIQQYIDARYIGSIEAAWHLLGFKMHKESPSVVRLALHLPGMHKFTFDSKDSIEKIKERAENERTTLTEYFKFCAENEGARCYTYQEFPEHYVWDKTKKIWKDRKQRFSIGRIYFAHPTSGERFYLRLLLTIVKGSTSFEHLKSYGGIPLNNFKEACIARGLLEDDKEWEQCLEEASVMKTGYQLRRLFSVILLECSPTDPGKLWETFGLKICDDVEYQLKKNFAMSNPTSEDVLDYGLYLLEQMLLEKGLRLKDFPGMPVFKKKWSDPAKNHLIFEHMKLKYAGLKEEVDANVLRLNTEQLHAYEEITNSVLKEEDKIFFLNGAAGTGKTFLYNTIAGKCRSEDKIVLTVASSGIASILLIGGRTAHSTFKIPIDVMDDSVCNFSKLSNESELFKRASLIIWDEVPMQHRFCVETVDRTLQDIRNSPKPFGGLTVVLGGDFRQTLPVIPKGRREQVVGASLRRSTLWHHVTVLHLIKNMRLDMTNDKDRNFLEFLNQVGSNPEESVQLPDEVTKVKDIATLIESVYPFIGTKGTATSKYLTERTILAPRNTDVSTINSDILQVFPGDYMEFIVADTLLEDNKTDKGSRTKYTTEYLNTQNPPSITPFNLQLKVGSPIMLLRNIAPKDGLCNGTRLKVIQCGTRVIEAEILTGSKAGEEVLIARITLSPSSTEMPIRMSRRQFPVRLAFSMTINKSQGQSVRYVGIDLTTPVFSHGQLYVALSRCTSSSRISVVLSDSEKSDSCEANTTTNIVYPEVLLENKN